MTDVRTEDLHHFVTLKKKRIGRSRSVVQRQVARKTTNAAIDEQLERLRVTVGEAREVSQLTIQLSNYWNQRERADAERREIVDWLDPLEPMIDEYILMIEAFRSYVSSDLTVGERYLATDLYAICQDELLPLITAYPIKPQLGIPA